MPASKPATQPSFGDHVGETELAEVDAHVIQPREYEELPELTDEMFAHSVYSRNEAELTQAVETLKRSMLRLESDVADALRATGADWEECGNAILREWLERRSA